ncbi:HAD family hydrolase [Patescibacteria group bacterium]
MVKGIIFDFGGVITTDPSLNLSKEEAKILNIEPQFLNKFYRDQDLRKFECDFISDNQFWESLKNKIENHTKQEISEGQLQQFQKTLINSFKLQPKFKDFILELKKNYKIALLTNNLPSWMPIWEKKFELREIFPVIVTSFEEKIRKPNSEIYLRTCGKLGLEPEECLFIDDQKKNIDGAEKAGLSAIQFTTEEGTIQKIQEKLKE